MIFSPGNDTIHAVKAAYNHLPGARTQLYGNLWSKDNPKAGPGGLAELRYQETLHRYCVSREGRAIHP